MGKKPRSPGAVGGRVWFSAVVFGLVGQIAWVVENMYFATLAQDIFANSGKPALSYLVTTLMVVLSAVTATATAIVAGGLCDRVGRRKPFIAWGYIAWGLTIMLFALLPMRVSPGRMALAAAALVVFDCVMTLAGSTANDAAFNAWVADNTSPLNRGRVNAVLAVLPVFAVVVVFIGLGGLYHPDSPTNSRFFLVLGLIPILAGCLALGTLRDASGLTPGGTEKGSLWYGFRPGVVKQNPVLYICLAAACLIGVAQQTFFSYLINFLRVTLGLGDGFVLPMAVIIVVSALLTGGAGLLCDRLGRRRFYLPLWLLAVAGILSFWLLQFADGPWRTLLLYGGGAVMMGGILSLTASFSATFQDCIPAGCQGRYQGVRMCFTVLTPMVIGPVISLLVGLDAMGLNGADFTPPYAIFLAAAIVALLAALPICALLRKTKEGAA